MSSLLGNDWTDREMLVIQAAVDEASRLMAEERKHMIVMLQHTLQGIAEKCMYLVDFDLTDELDTARFDSAETLEEQNTISKEWERGSDG